MNSDPCSASATFIGLTNNNGLIQFDSGSPRSPSAELPITGLQQSESIHGIDFRPATRQLFGVGSSNTLYSINPATGAATAVGPLGMTPSGTMFGFDFNPVSDRLFITTDLDQVLVVDPATGGATAGPPLMYTGAIQNPYIIGVAFSNNTRSDPIDQGRTTRCAWLRPQAAQGDADAASDIPASRRRRAADTDVQAEGHSPRQAQAALSRYAWPAMSFLAGLRLALLLPLRGE